MLPASATKNTTVGSGWEKPAEYPRAVAQTASSTALAMRTGQCTSGLPDELEADHAADDAEQEQDLHHAHLLGAEDHRVGDREHGADSHPHGVCRADGDRGHREREAGHAERERDDEEHRGPQPPEVLRRA